LVYFCLRSAAAERARFDGRLGRRAFWLYNAGLVFWIALNFFPIGWPQLSAVFEHGLAYARSIRPYDTMLVWLRGDVVFAGAALLMAWDFRLKLGPMYPRFVEQITRRPAPPMRPGPGE
jgi:nitric oxide reductase subunit B